VVVVLYFLPFSDPPSDAARAERVFTARSCAGCHGGGEAAREAPDLASSDAARAPWAPSCARVSRYFDKSI